MISLDPVVARPGETVTLKVQYRGEGEAGVAAQFEIGISEVLEIGVQAGDGPACRVNPEINRNATAFAFVPAACERERSGGCEAVRVVVFDFFDRNPLSDGPLVECTAQIDSQAEEGDYAIPLRRVIVADGSGALLPYARAVDGVLHVRADAPEPTATPPTPKPSPTPTALCAGDCNRDGSVTVEEIVAMVVSALGEARPECAAADPNNDGMVTIEEVIAAVSMALYGCAGR
ncbi:MAG: hypothetical protein N3C12_06515 [Candidatus Binatia bacterium]|nr:hypothetical protein [Candidatus Binatia bacterium]